MNWTKGKAISVTRRNKPFSYSYNLDGVHFTRVTAEKDLGVHITSSLSLDTHIHYVVAKANKLLELLKRTCPLLTYVNVRGTLYLSLVRRSQLRYATQVGSQTSTRWRRRSSEFKGEPRWTVHQTGVDEMSYTERLVKLNFLPLVLGRNLMIESFTANVSLALLTLLFLNIHRLFLTAVPDKVILSILKLLFVEAVLLRFPILIVLLSYGILLVH